MEKRTMPLLELRGISKRFGGNQALKEVSFSLERGEVHAVCGENGAGKSTLMNIIDGIHAPDAGTILLDGVPVQIRGPAHAQSLGIGLVHQEIALCPDATVAENIFMAELNQSSRFTVDYADLNRRAAIVLQRLRAAIRPEMRVEQLSVCEQQLVEIAKALTLDCRVLIFDEPTAALTETEAEALFAVMRDLRADGLGIIYISHRMAEIFGRCDRVTVLRDGQYVSCDRIEDLTPPLLVKRLVGRDLGALYPPKQSATAAPTKCLLEVRDLSDDDRFSGISFSLHAGEVLGIAGLMGAGRSEIAEAVCALRPLTAGSVVLNGAPFAPKNYQDAIKQGVVYLSEDRKLEGVFLELPIATNISAMDVTQVSRGGLLDSKQEALQAQTLGERLSLKADGIWSLVGNLSGGNQQKVAIAKLLAVKPLIMFMDEPTRGVDVKAKSEIHRILRELANQGIGIVVISSELPEVIGLCDRVLVIREGRLAGELKGSQVTEEAIMHLASGLHAEAIA